MKKYSLFILLLLVSVSIFSQTIMVDYLQCEHKANPIAINTAAPQFGWQLQYLSYSVMDSLTFPNRIYLQHGPIFIRFIIKRAESM